MGIVKAGHLLRVPQCRAFCLAAFIAAGAAGCSLMHPNRSATVARAPSQTSDGSSARDPMAALLASTLPTSEPATAPVVTQAPTVPEPATEPTLKYSVGATAGSASSVTTEPTPQPAITSNGGEFATEGQTIHAEEAPPTPLQFSVLATYLHGGVNGSVQIPKGGRNGTSSGNRPRLNGMGIDTADIPDVEVGAKWGGNQQLFAGMQIIQLDGAATVPRDLVSQGITFPKGSRTNNSLRLSWYRFGYRYDFVVDSAPNGVPDITLTPQIDAVLWDFAYNYHVRKVGTATRSMAQPGMQVGGTVAWRPDGGPFSLEAFAASFPQVQDLATISVESIYGTYHFYEFHRFNFTGRLGVEWEQQSFRDSKKLPNRINIDFGPMLMVGLNVDF